jgi:hypothetical protein
MGVPANRLVMGLQGVFELRKVHLLACAATALIGASSPALGQRASLAMLGELERGRWELRLRGETAASQQLCLGDARRLIQLRHPAAACEQLVISDGPTAVTVQYTCRGNGYGRTQIRRESSRLIQIDSQGIANGLPFAFAAEGRRVGDCTA